MTTLSCINNYILAGPSVDLNNLSLSILRTNENQDSNNRMIIENNNFKVKQSLNNDIPSILSAFRPKILPLKM